MRTAREIIKVPFRKIANMYTVERNIWRLDSPNFKGSKEDELKLTRGTLALCRKGSRNYIDLLIRKIHAMSMAGYDKSSKVARLRHWQELKNDCSELLRLKPNAKEAKELAETVKKKHDNAWIGSIN